MTVLLGLLAALSVGTSDFLGGLASRRADPVVVTAASSLVGLLLAFVAALVVVGEASMADVAWGALGGVVLAGGLVALYAGYARARVSIAAPVAGVGAAALPVIVASVFGDDALSPTATAGVLLGLLAIGLVSMARSEQRGSVGSSVLYGLGGAVGVGMLLVCLANTSEDSGLWPIVAARGSGFVVLSLIIAARRLALSTSRGVWPHVIGIAALVTAGNALFLTAARLGSTSVAAVLTSLFPAATVFWAWLVFRERLRGAQMLGLGIALVAVVLIVAG
ncbi:MAG: DMT family transporter [Acidimicrobiaceae bacterium]|nr:DMT family transporter [Acidimicrobiaceae bacterium]MXZ99800.1 DMT family transporter [Acidimicrobiaceae bacterium]MYE76941.1 DMT family transporter [Acidimicrobiaceae bacterium]MYE96967.1 DMT family transporter [Acidimicrobiaceae bacterium]MYH42619.1 DMT family transporter [Acidimicrobiaceae bacterium]